MAIFGLKIDSGTHDLVAENGMLQLVKDEEVVSRSLESRLQMIKGEWILDKNYGLDFGLVFGKRIIDMQAMESVLKRYILATEGVVSIVVFILDYDGENQRKLSLKLSVKTIYSNEISIGGLTIG